MSRHVAHVRFLWPFPARGVGNHLSLDAAITATAGRRAGARGLPGPGKGKRGTKVELRLDAPPTLAELGLDKKTSMVAQQLAAFPAKELKTIATGKTTLSKVRRELMVRCRSA